MQVKKYLVNTMPEAINLIRNDLGPNAVILHTEKVRNKGMFGMLGRSQLEVIAAVDTDIQDFPTTTSATEQTIQSLQSELSTLKATLARVSEARQDQRRLHVTSLDGWYRRLIEQGASESLVQQLISIVSDELSRWALDNENVLNEYWHIGRQIPTPAKLNLISDQPQVLFIIGPTGVGKTTTIAKLAANFARKSRQGLNVLIITTDTFRVAAIPQIVTLGEILGIPVKVAYSPHQLATLVEDSQFYDLILIDTPGRSQHAKDELAELSSYLTVINEKLVYLAITASSKYEDMNRTIMSFGDMPIDGLVLTKIDETISLGAAYTLTCETGLPLCYLTTGQRIPEDIEIATTERVVELIVDAVPGTQPNTRLKTVDREYAQTSFCLEEVL